MMVLYLVSSFYIYLDLQKHTVRVHMTAILTVLCKNIYDFEKNVVMSLYLQVQYNTAQYLYFAISTTVFIKNVQILHEFCI